MAPWRGRGRAHASGQSSRETGLRRRWRAAGGVLHRLEEEPKKHGKGGGLASGALHRRRVVDLDDGGSRFRLLLTNFQRRTRKGERSGGGAEGIG
jgi:hypothetical protein